MKTAGNILLVIAGIFSILCLLAGIAGTVVLFIFSSDAFADGIRELIKNGTFKPDETKSIEEAIKIVQHGCKIGAICSLIGSILFLAAAVVAFVGMKIEKMGMYIANIILGVFTASILAIIGGILGVAGGTFEKPANQNSTN